MIRWVLLVVIFVSVSLASDGQIVTTDLTQISPQDIGDLIAGKGAVVSNVRYTGAQQAAGTFSGGVAAGLGLESGVILSTGDIANIRGPNDTPDMSTAFENPGDPDLDKLVDPFETYDASVLEFDVVVSNTFELVINYVFASEEYEEFVGSPFNDVFAFYVNGVNVAVVAGQQGTPVSINTINGGSNGQLYRNNPQESPIANTQFDGFTVPLTARATVSPGVKTRVKIVIADTSDTIYDSAVILASSGITGGRASVSFDAAPSRIRRGESTTLLWKTQNASSVQIDQGVGSQPVSGAVSVSPQQTTTYTLTATGAGGSTTSSLTVEVLTQPQVVISAQPETLVQGTSEGGATTTYTIANIGGSSTAITLTQQGDFFTQSPTSFTLAPGGQQQVTITGLQRGTGSYRGASIPSGSGVPSGARVAVRLLAAPTPSGPTAASPESARLDIAAAQGTNPTGTATFRNAGSATIEGTLQSSVPWLIPQEGLVVIPPGGSATVSFTIDRSLRPLDSDLGSLEGVLSLVFRSGPSSAGSLKPASAVPSLLSSVKVVDTSTPPVAAGTIPPLQPGDVAYFVPGAGHVQGGSGLFFSDISLVNLGSSAKLDGVRMWYTPLSGGQTTTTTFGGIAATSPLAMADVVKTVFKSDSTLGSLQIRAENIEQLGVSANIFLQTPGSNPQFYGNTIPVIRSDRSVGPNESFYVTGLTQTSQSHTNMFVQETAGGTVIADIEFFNESGQKLGERTGVEVGPFRLVGLFHSNTNPFMPTGSVSAVITSRNESTGRFSAYATPVDRISGDSWSLVDWNAQQSFAGNEEMIIPVAGALQGGGNLYFRTGFAAVNRSDQTATGILRYVPRQSEGRPPIDRSITLGPKQSAIFNDVTTNLFGVDPSQFTLGYMKFTPQSGSLSVTSRNFATEGDDPGTFGTGVATLPESAALSLGQIRRIGGVRDASLETVQARRAGTFRSNVGLMETSGLDPVTVRITVHFSFNSSLVSSRGSGSREYTLQPNEYRQLTRISREILGAGREDYGDLENLQIDFAVVGGGGEAVVYVSSVENDTGDSILRVD